MSNSLLVTLLGTDQKWTLSGSHILEQIITEEPLWFKSCTCYFESSLVHKNLSSCTVTFGEKVLSFHKSRKCAATVLQKLSMIVFLLNQYLH